MNDDKKASAELMSAIQLIVDVWDHGDLAAAVRLADQTLQKWKKRLLIDPVMPEAFDAYRDQVVERLNESIARLYNHGLSEQEAAAHLLPRQPNPAVSPSAEACPKCGQWWSLHNFSNGCPGDDADWDQWEHAMEE